MTKNIWGSPFGKDQKKPKEPKEPKEEKPKKIPRLTKSDVRMLLDCSAGSVSEPLVCWVERWMTQLMRERSFPPHLVRAGAYQYLLDFLGDGATEVLNAIRRDHYGLGNPPNGDADVNEFGFLLGVPMVV
jgi:hypothetical protein